MFELFTCVAVETFIVIAAQNGFDVYAFTVAVDAGLGMKVIGGLFCAHGGRRKNKQQNKNDTQHDLRESLQLVAEVFFITLTK